MTPGQALKELVTLANRPQGIVTRQPQPHHRQQVGVAIKQRLISDGATGYLATADGRRFIAPAEPEKLPGKTCPACNQHKEPEEIRADPNRSHGLFYNCTSYVSNRRKEHRTITPATPPAIHLGQRPAQPAERTQTAPAAAPPPPIPAAETPEAPAAVRAPAPSATPMATPDVATAAAPDDGPPPWVDLDEEEPYTAELEPDLQAPPFQALPVRETSAPSARTAPRRDAPLPAQAVTLLPTEEGEFWASLVGELAEKELINALVRELALQSQLLGRDTDRWQLRLERESLNQPVARERLKTALHTVGYPVELDFEMGKVTDTPSLRHTVAAHERQRAAQALIENDPLVQTMLRDFGGKIVPDSVKPL